MSKIFINCTTNETEIIPLTEEEIQAVEQKKIENQTVLDAEQAEAEAKAAARQAILNRLGLTAEEAQLLLGGN
jgi:hypothetical protein